MSAKGHKRSFDHRVGAGQGELAEATILTVRAVR